MGMWAGVLAKRIRQGEGESRTFLIYTARWGHGGRKGKWGGERVMVWGRRRCRSQS
jgi:hypothetical protein